MCAFFLMKIVFQYFPNQNLSYFKRMSWFHIRHYFELENTTWISCRHKSDAFLHAQQIFKRGSFYHSCQKQTRKNSTFVLPTMQNDVRNAHMPRQANAVNFLIHTFGAILWFWIEITVSNKRKSTHNIVAKLLVWCQYFCVLTQHPIVLRHWPQRKCHLNLNVSGLALWRSRRLHEENTHTRARSHKPKVKCTTWIHLCVWKTMIFVSHKSHSRPHVAIPNLYTHTHTVGLSLFIASFFVHWFAWMRSNRGRCIDKIAVVVGFPRSFIHS